MIGIELQTPSPSFPFRLPLSLQHRCTKKTVVCGSRTSLAIASGEHATYKLHTTCCCGVVQYKSRYCDVETNCCSYWANICYLSLECCDESRSVIDKSKSQLAWSQRAMSAAPSLIVLTLHVLLCMQLECQWLEFWNTLPLSSPMSKGTVTPSRLSSAELLTLQRMN